MLNELFSGERIYGFCEKVCYFFVVNLLFLVFNLPVLCFFLFVGITQVGTYLPLFLLCMLSAAPAFSAVLYSMGRLMRGTEVHPFRDYLKGYKMNSFLSLQLGAVQLIAIFILWTNVKVFSNLTSGILFTIVFLILFAFCIAMTPNLYLLASRYEMKPVEIIRVSAIITVTRPVCTLGYIAAVGIALMLIELCAGISVLFIFSGYGFLVAFMSKPVLKSLEKGKDL